MLAVLKGSLALTLIILNVLLACVPLFLAAPLKFAVDRPAWRNWWSRRMNPVIPWWVGNNARIFRWFGLVDIDLRGADGLDADHWYLVVSNHSTWADIVLLQLAFNRRIPPLKFFTKQQLVWVPFLGQALWTLDFPFMRRFSREQLEANPDLRERDRETTRITCERVRDQPTSLFIFPEGTRFTAEKHALQDSPYRHLLKPKAGGVAFVLGHLGDRIDAVLDATILYPGGRASFWDLLCGRVPQVTIEVDALPVPAESAGDYLADADVRAWYHHWLSERWSAKDTRLGNRNAGAAA